MAPKSLLQVSLVIAFLSKAAGLSFDGHECQINGASSDCETKTITGDGGPNDFKYASTLSTVKGLFQPIPDWYAGYVPYETLAEQGMTCKNEMGENIECTPIWMLCPSEDTGGWDGGDMLRLGSRMPLRIQTPCTESLAHL